MLRSRLMFFLFLALGFFEYFGPRFEWEYLVDLSVVLLLSLFIYRQCQRRCISRVIFGFRYAFFITSLVYLLLMVLYLSTFTGTINALVGDHWKNFVHGWFFCSLGVVLLNSPKFLRFLGRLQDNPARFVAAIYLAVPTAASFLLILPISLQSGAEITLLDAMFTSVSAISGTGLTVTNTGLTFSMFGQFVILIIMQAGGAGIVTFSGILLLLIGKELGLRERVIQDDTERIHFMGDLKTFTGIVAAVMIGFETLGAILIYPFMRSVSSGTGEAIFNSIFHSVSAFCTAGFTTLPDGMEAAAGAPFPLLVIAFVSIAGMLGLPTIVNLFEFFRSRQNMFFRLRAYSKLELIMATSVLTFGTLSIFLVEVGSEAYTSWGETLLHAFFQNSMRNAGFNSIPISSYGLPAIFILMSLMIVGGAPLSTSGGIKTSTVGVVLIFVISFIRGRADANFAGRRISQGLFLKAVTLVCLFLSVLFIGFVSLALTQKAEAIEILFETISALTVTGFSLGITPELDTIGKSIVIALMLIGRIGFLTAIYAVVIGQRQVKYRLPPGDFYVG